jgi:tRNA1Val (adenine37-N6)-methyltransferase
MGNSWFQFQQFRVEQDRCAMKISTDAVLLGTLVQSDAPKQILDIGTGTGVIALMLAQRFPQASITAIELDPEAAGQAAENCEQSPFSQRLTVLQGRFQDFPVEERFDLLVSNPPFYPDHLPASNPKRNQALHTHSLSFEELLHKASQLLAPSGSFWVILPPRQMKDFIQCATAHGLFPSTRVAIRDSAHKPVHREVVGFTFSEPLPSVLPIELLLKNEDGSYSEDYRNLISGFLLGF